MSAEIKGVGKGPARPDEGTVLIPAGVGTGDDHVLRVTHQAIESSVNPIALFELDGRIIYGNQAFLRRWGYDSIAAVTNRAEGLWEIQAPARPPVDQIKSCEGWVGVVRARKSDGTEFDILASLSLVAGSEAGTNWIMASFLDLTEPRRITAQMMQSERLSAIGQLAAGVAHEINNPASFVMANLDQVTKYAARMVGMVTETKAAVRECCGPEALDRLSELEKKYDIEYITNDIEDLIAESLEGMVRIRNIVSDLRKFSAWGESECEDIDINRMVDSALNLAMSEVRFRGRFERRFGEVPVIRSVQGRLANAVLNVVVNAAHSLDAKKAGDNVVTVSTGVEDGRIFIRVEDTGSGMSAGTVARIFDPFYSTKPAGVGTGLGLVITQDVIQKAGGEITVQSEIGRGSTFTLWLPLPADKDVTASSLAAAKDVRPARIMVIDDEQQVLKAMGRILRDRFQAEMFLSAAEAMARLETDHSYDLIICDLIMPGMDGHEFYHQVIRRWPQLEPRIVFFTGGAYTPELKGFYQSMKDRTIHKPLEGKKILEAIAQHLAPGA